MTTEHDSPAVRITMAGPEDAGQRIDNFLRKVLKGVPKTRIYRALRKGEVRVNGQRVRPHYHLVDGDRVRIPPIRHSVDGKSPVIPEKLLDRLPILYEDSDLIVLDKPAGLAVHGGTGMAYGLIEALRQLRPDLGFLELVHRLDRETSGCLMVARRRPALVALQRQLAEHREIRKHYLALVQGNLPANNILRIQDPLLPRRGKDRRTRVVVAVDGQPAHTVIRVRQAFAEVTLVDVELCTGRMHQARVHLAHRGHPVAGDRLYGCDILNRHLQGLGLGRLFLHAERLRILHPTRKQQMDFFAPLPASLRSLLADL